MTQQDQARPSILVLSPSGSGGEPQRTAAREQFLVRTISRTDDLEAVIDRYGPDAVVVSTSFPDRESYEVIERIAVHSPDIGVLAVTPTPVPHTDVALATRAGADGFVDLDAEPDTFVAAIDAVRTGGSWFPSRETRQVLESVAGDLDMSSSERRSRLTGVVFALVPLTGLVAAIQTGFWRRYMGAIGVRPVDLGVDPSSRVIDVIAAILYVVGIFGPLLLIGTWLDMLSESRLNRGVIAAILKKRRAARWVLSILWLVCAGALAIGPDTALTAVVGPVMAASILAWTVGASEELPRFLRIEGVSGRTLITGSLAFTGVFLLVLTYEVLVVGPDLRADGVHGYVAPRVLGITAQPVRAVNLNTDEVNEVLYLGGNADLYVLVDVCDDNEVDYLSVSTQRLEVIDKITCPSSASEG